jgi:hypothetical protein
MGDASGDGQGRRVGESELMTTIKRFGLAVAVLGLIAGASGRASAGFVTYYTENSAFGAGSAALSNANHTIAFSGGNNDVTITFNAILAGSPTSVNNALPVALGTFTVTETGNSNVGAPSNHFVLQINQTAPSVGFGTDSGPLSGSFQSNNNHHGEIDFASTTIVIGSVTYALQGLTGDNHALTLPNSGSVTLFATITDTTTGAVPEPSSLALSSIAGLTGLGYTWRRRNRAATA